MTILLCDPAVAGVPLAEGPAADAALVALSATFGPARALVRVGLAERLLRANDLLPRGVHLHVVEGHRRAEDQLAIIAAYDAELRTTHPTATEGELVRLSSRFVAPLAVAPHVAAAAVDLTLADDRGHRLDLGTPIDATPEASGGRCYFAAPDLTRAARRHRDLLAEVLGSVGLVNYPTEWWHWSYGDRYWALTTGAPAALYGPVSA